MNRRAMLVAAPAALLAGSVPAIAAPAESPIRALYQQWLEAKQAFNDSDFDEAGGAALYADVTAIEDEILAIRPQTLQDYAFKLIVLNDFAGIEGIPWGGCDDGRGPRAGWRGMNAGTGRRLQRLVPQPFGGVIYI